MTREPKPIAHQFEDDLGRLVDEYLGDGIDIASLKQILRYEAEHDHEARRRDIDRVVL